MTTFSILPAKSMKLDHNVRTAIAIVQMSSIDYQDVKKDRSAGLVVHEKYVLANLSYSGVAGAIRILSNKDFSHLSNRRKL